MDKPSKKLRFLSVFWAIMLSIGIIALAGSILLPSTKRARFDFQRPPDESADNAEAPAATQPTP